jgi:anti-sigma regulatory factor (Ser/Thr protein kinase)
VDERALELDLEPVLEAAGAARDATRRWLTDAGLPGSRLDEIQLVISELVTNAVKHAGTTLRLVVSYDGRRVLAEVFDDDPNLPSPAASADGIGGWGLFIVDRLSDRWGCEASTDGKRVWAELDGRR